MNNLILSLFVRIFMRERKTYQQKGFHFQSSEFNYGIPINIANTSIRWDIYINIFIYIYIYIFGASEQI